MPYWRKHDHSALLSGQILERVAFRLTTNCLRLGAFGALLSAYIWVAYACLPRQRTIDPGCARKHNPGNQAAEEAPLFRKGDLPLLQVELLRGSFGRFLLATCCFIHSSIFAYPSSTGLRAHAQANRQLHQLRQ